MFTCRWRIGPFVVVAVLAMSTLLTGCGPTARSAYFQPQPRSIDRPSALILTASADTLPPAIALTQTETSPPLDTDVPHSQSSIITLRSTNRLALTSPQATRHRNPDSEVSHRVRNPFGVASTERVAPRRHTIDPNSLDRKTHPLALVALGLSVGAYAPLLLPVSGTLAIILGITLPLTAVLLGVASLTIINRNRDRYRGKGWAMGAVILGTGVLGLALMATAALSGAKRLWEK